MTPERLVEAVAAMNVTAERSRGGNLWAVLADLVEATAAEHRGIDPWWADPSGQACASCGVIWPCQTIDNLAPLCDLLLGPVKA